MRDPETRVGFCVNCESRYDEAGTRLTDSNSEFLRVKPRLQQGPCTLQRVLRSLPGPLYPAREGRGAAWYPCGAACETVRAHSGKDAVPA